MADLPLSAAVLLVLRGLAGPWEAPGSEEPPAEREARLETISEAVATVAQDGAPGWRWGSTELAAALVATSYPESQRYLRAVHSGARLGDCKPGRPCQAACLNQVHQQLAISRAEWLASVGTDLQATTLCMAPGRPGARAERALRRRRR